jgi:hypothetical protein
MRKINGIEQVRIDYIGDADPPVNRKLLSSAFKLFFLSRGMSVSEGMRAPFVFGVGVVKRTKTRRA